MRQFLPVTRPLVTQQNKTLTQKLIYNLVISSLFISFFEMPVTAGLFFNLNNTCTVFPSLGLFHFARTLKCLHLLHKPATLFIKEVPQKNIILLDTHFIFLTPLQKIFTQRLQMNVIKTSLLLPGAFSNCFLNLNKRIVQFFEVQKIEKAYFLNMYYELKTEHPKLTENFYYAMLNKMRALTFNETQKIILLLTATNSYTYAKELRANRVPSFTFCLTINKNFNFDYANLIDVDQPQIFYLLLSIFNQLSNANKNTLNFKQIVYQVWYKQKRVFLIAQLKFLKFWLRRLKQVRRRNQKRYFKTVYVFFFNLMKKKIKLYYKKLKRRRQRKLFQLQTQLLFLTKTARLPINHFSYYLQKTNLHLRRTYKLNKYLCEFETVDD